MINILSNTLWVVLHKTFPSELLKIVMSNFKDIQITSCSSSLNFMTE